MSAVQKHEYSEDGVNWVEYDSTVMASMAASGRRFYRNTIEHRPDPCACALSGHYEKALREIVAIGRPVERGVAAEAEIAAAALRGDAFPVTYGAAAAER